MLFTMSPQSLPFRLISSALPKAEFVSHRPSMVALGSEPVTRVGCGSHDGTLACAKAGVAHAPVMLAIVP